MPLEFKYTNRIQVRMNDRRNGSRDQRTCHEEVAGASGVEQVLRLDWDDRELVQLGTWTRAETRICTVDSG